MWRGVNESRGGLVKPPSRTRTLASIETLRLAQPFVLAKLSDMDKEAAVGDLKRVATELKARSLSRSLYEQHGTIASATIEATFGSWNEAVVAAGLIPLPQGGLPKTEARRQERLNRVASQPIGEVSDSELLDDLCRLAKEIGRRPSGNQIAAKGKYGRDIYQRRWGSVAKAYEVAVARGE